jgi:hypothetical protein
LDNYSCTHNNNQREFIWTGTSIELAQALEEGYIVTMVYSALEYTDWSKDVFADYVADFMAQKIHATGFETDDYEHQEEFIMQCHQDYNIIIERQKMQPNPSKRTTSKLNLNSLWGKLGQRSDLTKTAITDSPAILRKYLDDPRTEVTDVELLNGDVVMITYGTRKDFIESHKHSNIAMAAWTTR